MSRRSAFSGRSSSRDTRAIAILLAVGLVLVMTCCVTAYGLLGRLFNAEATPTPPAASGTVLTVAYSPEKEQAFTDLVARFNAQGLKSPEGEVMQIEAVPLSPEKMMNAVLDSLESQRGAGFQAMSPDSSVWLEQLDTAWSEAQGGSGQVVGETVRYAVSPVVIAAWESVATQLGWPDRPISWQDLLSRAQSDPNFRWSHPSTSSASGLLAVLAEFYAGAGKTRGLTIDDVQSQDTLDYVAALEKTVRYYGEGDELALVQRALDEGRDFLDAFVAQEQMVVHFNTHRRGQERLVALYPAEGAMWQDHPLALLETADLSPLQRQTFAQFREYLLSREAQQLILSYGYRPADYNTPIDSPASPLTADNGVDPTEPKTMLQVPNASVIGVVRDVWWYTKRHTNVYLIADRSGSMEGEKLEGARQALRTFLDQIQGDTERVGLIDFSDYVNTSVPLGELEANRASLESAVDQLQAQGDTALLDAVQEANRQLRELGDNERINAIVVMTDGKENASYTSLQSLVDELEQNQSTQVVVFAIAYGDDADMDMLRAIAEPSGGRVLKGDPETIRDLYKILSTYF